LAGRFVELIRRKCLFWTCHSAVSRLFGSELPNNSSVSYRTDERRQVS
jgi:hypothetical protein